MNIASIPRALLMATVAGCGGPVATNGDAPPSVDGPSGPAPVSLTLTLHLENHAPYDAAYFAALDQFAAAFERHGAVLTFEPRQEVVAAADAATMFPALEQRGHAFGSHAAIGNGITGSLAPFVAAAEARRVQLEGVVNRVDHISGNCGELDWIGGIATAGFHLTTASTVGCLLSIAPADRPAGFEGLTCTSATDPVCHKPYPNDPGQRLHPWRALDGAHWLTDDPTGPIVMLASNGDLHALVEETTNDPGLPELTAQDIALALADLDAAIALADPQRVNSLYWVWGSWNATPIDPALLETFLDAIDARVASGAVRWRTVLTTYDDYLTWEAAHR